MTKELKTHPFKEINLFTKPVNAVMRRVKGFRKFVKNVVMLMQGIVHSNGLLASRYQKWKMEVVPERFGEADLNLILLSIGA